MTISQLALRTPGYASPLLQERYRSVRAQTEHLAAPLSPEDCALQSMPDASPVKWHLAHTSWFFETFILDEAIARYQSFHPQFRVLFNSYYNGVGDKHPRPERGMLSRPSLDEVYAYRKHVDQRMLELLSDERKLAGAVRARVELGLHHEQQHQELLLTDVKHLLSRNPLRPAYAQAAPSTTAGTPSAPLTWHTQAEGLYRIGHADTADATGAGERADFAFDNEAPRHKVWLNAYALASRLTTNGEYLAFMQDGGYTRAELWLSEGWDTAKAQGWQAPMYWEQRDGRWWQFTLHGLLPVALDAPVHHVSLFEADAFARWSGTRLPSEFEWEIAARETPVSGNFVEQALLQPRAASAARTIAQLYGDAWEWTASAYAPYPGFRPAEGAIGEYNGKFMCNQFVLRGGSCATPATHMRVSYRNFFPAAARWQFSGIRLARDVA